MRIRVRLFAIQREQLGRRELDLELDAPATIADAWSRLVALHPVLDGSSTSVRFARNGDYADPGETLDDGDELALIPPVAGGAGNGVSIELAPDPIDDAALARLRRRVATDDDGAVVLFLGQTRRSPGTPAPGEEAAAERFAGSEVVGLDYEAYDSMARRVLQQIAAEIEERFGVAHLAIVHRTGSVAVGETSVAICAASPHRGEAFDACRYAIEELKARAPIWKSERFADGSVWLGAPARTGPLVHVTGSSEERA
jgi:molybdopterin synthase catalytic subunit